MRYPRKLKGCSVCQYGIHTVMRMKWPSSMIPSNRSTSALCTRKLMCIIFIIYLSRYNPNDKHVLYRIFRFIRRFYVSLCISLHEMLCNSLLRQHLFVRPTRNKRKRSRRMVIKAASKGDCNKVKPSSPGSLAKFDESFCDTLCTDFGIPCWFLVLVCCTYRTRWDPIRIYFIPSLPARLDILFGIASL